MNADTPLPEVAGHLPPGAALVLAEFGEYPAIQRFVLTQLRSAMIYWESQRLDLDPIQWDVVVTTLVTQHATNQVALLQVLLEQEADVD